MHRTLLLMSAISMIAACGVQHIEISPGPDGQARADSALGQARYGDVIHFLAGTHHFERSLFLAIDGVTIRGDGMNQTILSFSSQSDRVGQAFKVNANQVTVEQLTIMDSNKHALVMENSEDLTVREVRIEWSDHPDLSTSGIHPLGCRNVLIEDSQVIGSAVEGIHVRDSSDVIVRNNRVHGNTIGVAIENSTSVDVLENQISDNTLGLYLANLPDRDTDSDYTNGHSIRALGNVIEDNNRDSRAPPGNPAFDLSAGSGLFIMSGHRIDIIDNELLDNQTINLGIISYRLYIDILDESFADSEYSPYTDTINIYRNRFGRGGYEPVGLFADVLTPALALFGFTSAPSITFDGYVDPDKSDADDRNRFQPAYALCIRDNDFTGTDGAAPFASFGRFDARNGLADAYSDITRHDCVHPRLPAVSLPQAPDGHRTERADDSIAARRTDRHLE